MKPSTPRLLRASALFGIVFLTGTLLSGCSGGSAGRSGGAAAAVPSVASVATTTASPAATAAAAVVGPLIRADTTDEESARWHKGWVACLTNHGVPEIPEANHGKFDQQEVIRKYPKAITACVSKRPELVTERFEREHPEEFQAHLRQFIACMKNDGQKIVFIPPDGWGVSDEAAASGYSPSQRSWVKCEKKAYGL
jgi:hypothetical protein